jgi:hypothetical protein
MGENEIERVYYEHDSSCTKADFWPMNARGLKTCKECSGVFDVEGKGVAVTSKKFDENYIPGEV